METPKRPGLRILVGAGCFADAAAALRLVGRLPEAFRAALGGVLVEEADTLAACQIPDQRVVLDSGATMRAPSLAQVRALFKADARAFRQSLAQAANPTGADWIFAEDKGELVGTSLRAAHGWDILVIGYRQVHRIPGKVVLLEADSPSTDTMDEAAKRLSQQLGARCTRFSVGPLQEHPKPDRAFEHRRFQSLDAALRALARTNAQAVILDLVHGPIRNPGDLAHLLEASRCPLIVFGPSDLSVMLEHNTEFPTPARPDGDPIDP
ncbi:hypothetical protein [Sulfitobacter sp. JB4-11]|uniref:hypothetical protein n=1 Tax=Sulfitobacter rhodophyticola TaxID=3238304 RepID=UPI00351165CC